MKLLIRGDDVPFVKCCEVGIPNDTTEEARKFIRQAEKFAEPVSIGQMFLLQQIDDSKQFVMARCCVIFRGNPKVVQVFVGFAPTSEVN